MLRLFSSSLPALLLGGCSCSAALTPDEAVRACVTLQVCSPLEFARQFGRTLENCTTDSYMPLPWPGTLENAPEITTGLEPALKQLYTCLAASRGDCARAERCWAPAGEPGACSPNAGLQSGTCQGEVLSGCSTDGHAFAVDCAHGGGVCGRTDFFFATYSACGVERCEARSAPTCRGGLLELCEGETVWRVDCARTGARCVPGENGVGASCVGVKQCFSSGSACSGSTVVSCMADGHEWRRDCTAGPTRKRCSDQDCVATGTECRGEPETCEGTAVRYCRDGYLSRFDCVGEGYGACSAGACTAKP